MVLNCILVGCPWFSLSFSPGNRVLDDNRWYVCAVCAVPGSGDAREHALGNAIKVFRNQANPDVKQASVRRSLRFRRDHDIFSNPCLSRVETLQVVGGLAVNVHVCLITSNVGCQPVNGKFLSEQIKSAVNDSAGNIYAYTSGCRCAKPWLKITLFNKRVLIILYWFGFATLNKVTAANYL